MVARTAQAPASHRTGVKARDRPVREPDRTDELPEDASLDEVREAARGCRRCPLWRNATQTVFGEGQEEAGVVFVGEQPGDQEDLAGKPFVGPAGRMFDAVLEESEIDRLKTYVTNAVKHFKFEPP